MRLFIAIDMPEEIKQLIENIQSQINIDGKFKFPNHYHLTLKFLGEVPEENIENIKQKLSKISFDEFELTASELGVFPNPDYIRVLWLGFEQNKKLADLKNKIDKMLPEFKDNHQFHPHITISRIDSLKDKDNLITALKHLTPKPKSFKINSFKLYKSTLTPKGAVYEELEIF